MSPVHSNTAPDFPIQRSCASPTPETLFPECPDDLSPKQMAGNLAPVAGQRGSISDCKTADCPPTSPANDPRRNLVHGPDRNFAANSSKRANARLIGIARLAAASPPAE